MAKRNPSAAQRRLPANVVVLHQRMTQRHKDVLNHWLEAGRCMGLCDACICRHGRDQPDYVLVWVRENPDPAYMITPEGMRWRLTDCIRGEVLATHASFEAALHHIRPVLDLHRAA